MATTARKTRKKAAAPTAVITYAQFDTGVSNNMDTVLEVVRDGRPISEWTPLTREDFTPRGGTPLYDAVGLMIAHMEGVQAASPDAAHVAVLVDRSGSMGHLRDEVVSGINEFVGAMSTVASDEVNAQGKMLLLVYTDGEENSSREHTADSVKKLVQAKTADGWEFIYLGANQDAWQVGGSIGITASTGYVGTAQGSSSALRSMGNVGVSYLADNASLGARAQTISSSSLGEDEVREIPKSEKKGKK